MIFDAILYGSAIVAILSVIARHGRNGKAIATRPVQSIDNTLATIHAIGEALPEDCFTEDVEAIAPEELLEEGSVEIEYVGTFDTGNATPAEAALVDAAEVAIACYWEYSTTDNVVPFRRPSQHPALEGLGIRELKKLASAAKVKNYNVMTKAKLIAALQAA